MMLSKFKNAVIKAGVKGFTYWESQKSNSLKTTELSGKKCDKVINNLEAIVNEIFDEAKKSERNSPYPIIISIVKDWKSIIHTIESKQTPLSNQEIDSIDSNLASFGDNWVKAFGVVAVTPYVHVMVCHTKSILTAHGSLSLFSQEGFESSHKYQKQIYYRSTCHDGRVSKARVQINSIEQILTKVFRMHMMSCKTKEEWKESCIST